MKRLGTVALVAALLSFGGTHGLQAQQHHGKKDDHDERQLSKKEQKELEKEIRKNEQRSLQLTKKEQKALDARIREQQAAQARYRAEQLRAQQRAYQAQVARDRELRTRVLAPATYGYVVSGNRRVTNRVGAELLQRAVSDGYARGYQAGRVDLSDRERFDYYDENGYRVGTYGFTSGYIPASDYQSYFRQGFERGYQDGYYQSNRFGSLGSSGKATILAAALATILGFTVH